MYKFLSPARKLSCLICLVAAALFIAEPVIAQSAFSITRTGTRDTLLFVHEGGFVGVGTTSLSTSPLIGGSVSRSPGLPYQSRMAVYANRTNSPSGNYAGVSSVVTGGTSNTVNLVGLFGMAEGTNDSTIGVYGKAAGIGMVPSLGGYFVAGGAGMGDNIAGYFVSRGLGANYGIWVDAGWTPAVLNRIQDGGPLISYRLNRSERASVSVHGQIVSHNRFTGSRLAWTEDDIERGILVTATGITSSDRQNPEDFSVPHVSRSRFANDRRILGAFLGLHQVEEIEEAPPALVASVGEGLVWVVETSRNIEMGDYLISSYVPGHAMIDPGTFDVSYVIGRAVEPVDWRFIQEHVGGRKRALVKVAFEHQAVNHAARRLKRDMELVEARLSRLEAVVDRMESPPDELSLPIDDPFLEEELERLAPEDDDPPDPEGVDEREGLVPHPEESEHEEPEDND